MTGADGARVYCSTQASSSGREHSARFVSHRGQLTRDSINILMEQVRVWLYPSLTLSAACTRLSAVVTLRFAIVRVVPLKGQDPYSTSMVSTDLQPAA